MRLPTASTHIAGRLRKAIADGRYPHRSALPSETALAAEFGAARNTVRRAIEMLVHEGLLQKSQGRRTIVNALRTEVRPSAGKLAFFSYLRPSFMYSNQIYFELFQHMVKLAQEQGLSMHFFNPTLIADWDPAVWSAPEWSGLFSVGLIPSSNSGPFIARMQTLPNLINIDENDGTPGAFTVTTDNYTNARLATAHLIEIGCKSPVFMRYDAQTNRSFRERQNGYEAVIRETWGEEAIRLVILPYAETGYMQAYQEMEKILKSKENFDGVFCANDEIAILLLEAALRYQVKVPEELKIVGFDGTYAGQHVTPKLTTVSQPLEEIAASALSLALELSGGVHRAPCTIKLPGYLLRGETT